MKLQKLINQREKIEITKKIKLEKLMKVEIVVIIVNIILGILLHFVYNWSGKNILVASFSPVNKSVWEHLKLIFYPMLVSGIVEYFFINKIAHNYFESKTIGIFGSISFIIVTFFTYTGILGANFFIIDILIFISSILLGEWISYKLIKSNVKTKILAGIIITFFLICFIACTYSAPKVNLFRDPISGSYGLI